jgi:hypothetical protein
MSTKTTAVPGQGVSGTPTPAASTQQYLVISAGVPNGSGGFKEGGQLFAFPLTEVEGIAIESVLAVLGVKNNTVKIIGNFTVPAERLNLLGLIIKWRAHQESIEADASIITEAALPSGKSMLEVAIKF